MDGKSSSGLHIGTVAVRCGLTIDTIRFYEKQGLLAKPHRSPGGFRLYSEGDIDRLSFVNRAQALGFSLLEIRELLLLRDTGSEACSHVHDLLDQKLITVQQKIADLRKLEKQLRGARERCDLELAKECTRSCPVIDEISRSRKEVQ
ncbi:MAG TPA: MerR family DNA-binding protein [Edaphobacter sp.]|uniref:MerR family DNA-binding protein n=1 Tax=Edaphobacter sp. TaxID=1934404 RepID=UPI002C7C9ACE|nr:MerR family DNA-binding protein [Edaphobacter sp.]HUZ97075.1 MerR family DNA-binding protein [Edaphobacter sp.]